MNDLPKRKHPRLKEHDYSQNGYYHIVICTEKKLPILSRIDNIGCVGRGLAPAEAADLQVRLSDIGDIAKKQLFELSNRYNYVKIDKYCIMPTHIHAIIVLVDRTAGASPRPTLTDIVCAYKSITTRLSNQQNHVQGRKIWQTSFYEQIIRNEKGYQEVWQYIDENPLKWDMDEYYCK